MKVVHNQIIPEFIHGSFDRFFFSFKKKKNKKRVNNHFKTKMLIAALIVIERGLKVIHVMPVTVKTNSDMTSKLHLMIDTEKGSERKREQKQ